jgi:hypothetical protein
MMEWTSHAGHVQLQTENAHIPHRPRGTGQQEEMALKEDRMARRYDSLKMLVILLTSSRFLESQDQSPRSKVITCLQAFVHCWMPLIPQCLHLRFGWTWYESPVFPPLLTCFSLRYGSKTILETCHSYIHRLSKTFSVKLDRHPRNKILLLLHGQ